ncbi:MAG TPA: hypothetical protein VGQ58_09530 [Candidatus Limnocylindrales bacterium]|nr:hypothetical protein [Candidatus Limnocylindrales bacterium]
MNLLLAAVAIVVVAGGVIAVSSRESRPAILGLTLAAVAAPLVADPLPDMLPLASRLVAAILGGFLLWVAVRGQPATRGSRLGWPVEGLLAAAAAVAGFGAIGIVAPGPAAEVLVGAGRAVVAPREALAAGFATGALAIGPIFAGRDVLRLGTGLVLAVLAAQLVRVGLAGSPSGLEQIVTAGLTVVVAGASATLAANAVQSGRGLEPSTVPRPAAGPRPAAEPGGETGEEASPRRFGPRSAGRRSLPGRWGRR